MNANPFGIVGDIKIKLAGINERIASARHLIACIEGALRDGKLGDGPDEIDPHRLANNLADALVILNEVSA